MSEYPHGSGTGAGLHFSPGNALPTLTDSSFVTPREITGAMLELESDTINNSERLSRYRNWFRNNYTKAKNYSSLFDAVRTIMQRYMVNFNLNVECTPEYLVSLLNGYLATIENRMRLLDVDMRTVSNEEFKTRITIHKKKICEMVDDYEQHLKNEAEEKRQYRDQAIATQIEVDDLRRRLAKYEGETVQREAVGMQRGAIAVNEALNSSMVERITLEQQENERLRAELAACRAQMLEREQNCMIEIAEISNRVDFFQDLRNNFIVMFDQIFRRTLSYAVTASDACDEAVSQWLNAAQQSLTEREQEIREAHSRLQQKEWELAQMNIQLDELRKKESDLKVEVTVATELIKVNQANLVDLQAQLQSDDDANARLEGEVMRRTIDEQEWNMEEMLANVSGDNVSRVMSTLSEEGRSASKPGAVGDENLVARIVECVRADVSESLRMAADVISDTDGVAGDVFVGADGGEFVEAAVASDEAYGVAEAGTDVENAINKTILMHSPSRQEPVVVNYSVATPVRSAAATPPLSQAATPVRALAASPVRALATTPVRALATTPVRARAATSVRARAATAARALFATPPRAVAATPVRSPADIPIWEQDPSPVLSPATIRARYQADIPIWEQADIPIWAQAASPVRSPAATPPRAQVAIPPSAQVAIPPSAQVGTPPSAQVGTLPSAQVATPPCAQVGTSPRAQVAIPPSAQIGTPPSAQVGTLPSAQVATLPSAQVGTPPSAQTVSPSSPRIGALWRTDPISLSPFDFPPSPKKYMAGDEYESVEAYEEYHRREAEEFEKEHQKTVENDRRERETREMLARYQWALHIRPGFWMLDDLNRQYGRGKYAQERPFDPEKEKQKRLLKRKQKRERKASRQRLREIRLEVLNETRPGYYSDSYIEKVRRQVEQDTSYESDVDSLKEFEEDLMHEIDYEPVAEYPWSPGYEAHRQERNRRIAEILAEAERRKKGPRYQDQGNR